MKGFKGVLFLLMVVCISFTCKVKAESVCNTYQNYYFFIEANKESYYNKVKNGEAVWKVNHRTYFPLQTSLIEASKAENNLNRSRVCLKRDENDDVSCSGYSGPVMTLEKFYTLYLQVVNSSENIEISIPGSDTKTSSNVLISNNDGKIVSYYTHGKWFKVESNGDVVDGGVGVDLSKSQISALVSASALPNSESSTSISMDFEESLNNNYNSVVANISRDLDLNSSNNSSIELISIVWPCSSGQSCTQEPINSVISPALYYVEFEGCEEQYKAVIDYYYEGTNERVKFDNDEPNPWSKTGLKNGDSDNVSSPSKSGCTPSKENVDFTIKDSDFNYVVYYTCKSSETIENPKTGSMPIIVAVIVGLIAIVTFVVFAYKNKIVKK